MRLQELFPANYKSLKKIKNHRKYKQQFKYILIFVSGFLVGLVVSLFK